MKPELLPAIDALKNEVADLEGKLNAAKTMTNRMCELAGVPPVYANISGGERASTSAIQADQFYGKVQSTAAREFLEMRKAVGQGPASPRDIYDGLMRGGFRFDTKDENNALTGLRAMLRKNSSIFHRLPNNQYGLLVWYPGAKPAKTDEGDEAPSTATKPTAAKRERFIRRNQTPAPSKLTNTGKRTISPEVDQFVLTVMEDGADWTLGHLKDEAIKWGGLGIDEATDLRRLNLLMLRLKHAGRIGLHGKGLWYLIKNEATSSPPIGEVVRAFKGAA